MFVSYYNMSNNLMDELEQFKSTYYSGNKKNFIFKTEQKHDLANKIYSEFGQDELFKKSVYQIKGTNKVYINFPVFKTFVNHSNYKEFVLFTQSIFNKCIKTHGIFECHVNLDGLTITAVERHQRLVELFCTDPSERDGMEYTMFLTKVYIYNTPSVIDNITNLLKKLLDPDILKRLIKYSRAESPYQLSLL